MDKGLSLIMRAAVFAAERHRGQVRKGADAMPYIKHPLAVAQALAEEGGVGDAEMLAAALLHDTIEDTPTVYDDVSKEFSERVANLVVELTDDKRLPMAERKRLQVDHAAHISPDAQQIKLADKLCNLREILACPPADWPPARRAAYFEWSKAVVDRMRGANPALELLFDAAYAKGPSAA
jgi:guanosine-3',5'-bis(diphosphate) 3'-pyrophosphohydrolase